MSLDDVIGVDFFAALSLSLSHISLCPESSGFQPFHIDLVRLGLCPFLQISTGDRSQAAGRCSQRAQLDATGAAGRSYFRHREAEPVMFIKR